MLYLKNINSNKFLKFLNVTDLIIFLLLNHDQII